MLTVARPMIASLFLFFAGALLHAQSVGTDTPPAPERPRAVVLVVADGFSPTHYGLLHEYRGVMSNHIVELERLQADPGTTFGLLDTKSLRTTVTDSAASATAMGCATITLNGRIAVDAKGAPVESVLERARSKGWMTAIVTTARVTHATPACFIAHHVDRNQERAIATQIASEGKADLLLGGGALVFMKNGKAISEAFGEDAFQGTTRFEKFPDDADLSEVARSQGGYALVGTYAELLAAPIGAKVLGLFAPMHLPYEIDREELGMKSVPTLAQMTVEALRRCSAAKKPFFLMVEAGRIDHAAHANDAATLLRETLAYDDAIGVIRGFLEAGTHDVTLVVTSDHATGGFAIGLPQNAVGRGSAAELAWLERQTVSFEYLGEHSKPEELREASRNLLGFEINDQEWKLIESARVKGGTTELAFLPHRGVGWTSLLGFCISRRTGLLFSTNAHTADPVFVWARGRGAEKFRGIHSNVLVGEVLFDSLEIRR